MCRYTIYYIQYAKSRDFSIGQLLLHQRIKRGKRSMLLGRKTTQDSFSHFRKITGCLAEEVLQTLLSIGSLTPVS